MLDADATGELDPSVRELLIEVGLLGPDGVVTDRSDWLIRVRRSGGRALVVQESKGVPRVALSTTDPGLVDRYLLVELAADCRRALGLPRVRVVDGVRVRPFGPLPDGVRAEPVAGEGVRLIWSAGTAVGWAGDEVEASGLGEVAALRVAWASTVGVGELVAELRAAEPAVLPLGPGAVARG